jgi:aspartate dehydrogenase
MHIAVVGCGAIGSTVIELIAGRPDIMIGAVIVPQRSITKTRELLAGIAPAARVLVRLDPEDKRPDLLVECAGHAAIREHVLPALIEGIPCVLASVGALSDAQLCAELKQAARAGGVQFELLAGAIGGIDALAAARHGGLDEVVYTGRKPPSAWTGTPAAQQLDLQNIGGPFLIFEGNAREAAALYPKNANVAATVALAGSGFEGTVVRLFADPGVTENVHHIRASGAFGELELTLRGKPLARNPKTSSLTVYSVVRAICRHVDTLKI